LKEVAIDGRVTELMNQAAGYHSKTGKRTRGFQGIEVGLRSEAPIGEICTLSTAWSILAIGFGHLRHF
jgi:hypothetical protein